jgi:hypothetical protein
MGHKRTDSKKRYYYASLICAYLERNNINQAHMTAKDIVEFHQLSGKSVYSVSAFLNYLLNKRVNDGRFGFYTLRSQPFKKSDYPHYYTVKLADVTAPLLICSAIVFGMR